MAEHYRDPQGPEYEETVAPNNPPNAVLNREVRRGAWWLYFFPIVVIAIVFGAFLWYWAGRDANGDEAIGTTGTEIEERSDEVIRPSTGGFEPGDRPDGTREEIERRGGDSN
jgi:hypothetical protein